VHKPESPLQLSVHAVAPLQAAQLDAARRTRWGRCKMLGLLLVCAAPVLASYLSYYFVRPTQQRNFGELIAHQPMLPAAVAYTLQGQAQRLDALAGQWLLLSVAGGACDSACENHLYLQRQLRESLGREKERLDWVWLIPDAAPVPERLRPALAQATVLRLDAAALHAWLQAGAGQDVPDHLYLVDPFGRWMLRWPPHLDASGAARAKRDIERLLRASASWDRPGRAAQPGASAIPPDGPAQNIPP